jgi:hypothetical protein
LFGKERTSEVKKESADAIHFHINENIWNTNKNSNPKTNCFIDGRMYEWEDGLING